jgi:hypothetical protein
VISAVAGALRYPDDMLLRPSDMAVRRGLRLSEGSGIFQKRETRRDETGGRDGDFELMRTRPE